MVILGLSIVRANITGQLKMQNKTKWQEIFRQNNVQTFQGKKFRQQAKSGTIVP